MNDLLTLLAEPFEPKHISWKEEWRTIPGFEDRYEASSCGRVRTFFINNSRRARVEPLYLKGWVDRNGYRIHALYCRNNRKNCQLHRLVATVFLGESNLDVNHRDGDKLNNRIDNLEYCTRADNIYHSHYVLGKQMGESHPNVKLTDDQVAAIRLLLEQGVKQRVIAERFGVRQSYISSLKTGRIRRIRTKDGAK